MAVRLTPVYPKITWGPGFTRTLSFGDVLDGAVSWTEPREGYATVQSESTGAEDAWELGRDSLLRGTLRFIPVTTITGRTGWDGTQGVKMWLAAARTLRPFRLYPDATSSTYVECVLVEPMQGAPEREPNGWYKLAFVARVLGDAPVTAY